MEAKVVAAVLLAALLHAGWNAAVRVRGERLIVMATMTGSSALIAGLLLPFAGPPTAAAWPYLAGSSLLHLGYNLSLLKAYQHGELSQVYPTARGAAPLLSVALAWAFAGERLGGEALAGIVIVSAGILGLALARTRGGEGRKLYVLYALCTAGFIAAYTTADALGARLAGSAHVYSLWLFALNGLYLPLFVLARRRRQAAAMLAGSWLAGAGSGVMSLAAYWLVIWALTRSAIGPVAALREVSVVFAALLGALLLKERVTPARLAAVAAVFVGAVLLRR